MLVVFGIIVIVAGLLGLAYYTDQSFVTGTVNNVLSFTTNEKCNQVGDCITFNIPVPVENHDTVPVDYDTNTVTSATYYENGTEIPQQSYITGVINDVSYSKTGVRQSSYLANEDVMMVQIGNIISIDAQIKIIDPVTKNIIEPRIAKYTLIMTCSDLSEFCNLSSITRRGTTNAVGTFNERITTDSTWVPALYEVEVFAISETLDQFGIPYDVTNTLFVETYK